MRALTTTDFHFNGQKSVYHGKVRDVYNINDDLIVMLCYPKVFLLKDKCLIKLQRSSWMLQLTFALIGSLLRLTLWSQWA